MAAPDPEPVTVTSDGITVRKTLNLEDFDTIAIVYEVTSDRDDDIRFHIDDRVPAGVSREDIDYHPRYEAAESSFSAESVTFEDRLAPGEDSRIVLGIKNHPEDQLEELLDEPTVELLESEAPDSENVSRGETSDVKRAGEQMSSGAVVRVLARELRRNQVDEQARRQLRDGLLDTGSELENQLADLEDRIADLEVYQPPIEDFLSEYGPAERVLSAFRDELSEIEEAVRTMQDRTDEVVGGLEHVRDRIESTGDGLETADARMETLGERLEKKQDDITEFDNRNEASEGKAGQVSAGVRTLEQRTGELDGKVAELNEELESIRESIRRDIRGIEAEIEEFESFRDRLSAAFGGEGVPFDIESDDG